MDKLGSLKHLFVTVFMSQLATFLVTPAMPDVTMMALCPGQDQCSLAIYLSGFQQAVCLYSLHPYHHSTYMLHLPLL